MTVGLVVELQLWEKYECSARGSWWQNWRVSEKGDDLPPNSSLRPITPFFVSPPNPLCTSHSFPRRRPFTAVLGFPSRVFPHTRYACRGTSPKRSEVRDVSSILSPFITFNARHVISDTRGVLSRFKQRLFENGCAPETGPWIVRVHRRESQREGF